MDKAILVTGWVVKFHGDPSVGISSGEWSMKPETYFDNSADLEEFRRKIKEAFSLCLDEACIEVLTEKEVVDEIEREEKLFGAADEAERDRDRHRWY